MRLAVKLHLVVVIPVLAMLLAGTLVIWKVIDQAALERYRSAVIAAADHLSDELTLNLKRIDNNLVLLSGDARLRSLDIMESLAEVNHFDYIFVTTSEGVITLTAPLDRRLLGRRVFVKEHTGAVQRFDRRDYLTFSLGINDDIAGGFVVICIAVDKLSQVWFRGLTPPNVQYCIVWPEMGLDFSSDPDLLPPRKLHKWVSLSGFAFHNKVGPLAYKEHHKTSGAWIVTAISPSVIEKPIFAAVAGQAMVLILGALLIYLGLSVWLKRLLAPLRQLQTTIQGNG